MSRQENMHDIIVRLKSGREFRLSCKRYKISRFKIDGTISDFSYEGGIGECPVYFNALDIEAVVEITKNREESASE